MRQGFLAAFVDELAKIAAFSPAMRALGTAAGVGAAAGAVTSRPGEGVSGAMKGAIAGPLALHGAKHAVRFGKAVQKVAPKAGIKNVGSAIEAARTKGGRETLKGVASKGWETAKKESLY